MKQMQPKTILAIGLPGSFVINHFVSGLVFYVFSPATWHVSSLVFSVSTWLLLSVPIIGGMSLIRSRIRFSYSKPQKLRAATNCLLFCILLAIVGCGIAYTMNANLIDLPIFGSISLFAGMIGALLSVFTGINIAVRWVTVEPISDS